MREGTDLTEGLFMNSRGGRTFKRWSEALAAGSVRVEIQDGDGRPIRGYGLEDCCEVFGDDLERVVTWKGGPGVGELAGRAIRLRFVMMDADLYSMQFKMS